MVEWALTVFALLNTLDLMTTYYGLQKGLVERNPIAKQVLERFGKAGLYSYKQIMTGAIVALYSVLFGADFETIIWAFNVLMALVVAWNSAMIAIATWRRG